VLGATSVEEECVLTGQMLVLAHEYIDSPRNALHLLYGTEGMLGRLPTMKTSDTTGKQQTKCMIHEKKFLPAVARRTEISEFQQQTRRELICANSSTVCKQQD